MNSLLDSLIKSHYSGLKKTTFNNLNVEDKYNSNHILKMAKTLSLPEISIILNATKYREKGLIDLRLNKINSGFNFLKQARSLFNEVKISEEANLIAESFQNAAESFYYYKIENFTKSISLLLTAVNICEDLANIYNYPVGVRKIHLLRNIARIHIKSGSSVDAFYLCSEILLHLKSNTTYWPININLKKYPESLSLEERAFLLNQVFEDLSLLLCKNNIEANKLLQHLEVFLLKASKIDLDSFQQTSNWLMAKYSSISGNIDQFLKFTEAFYLNGVDNLPSAWNGINKEVECNFGNDLKLIYL